ncbi:MAG TPA: TlpA disulfide reductase family protein [Methylophilaceae bacterium]|nr:TlpA disulfide reductase family protein [Methylophilaceae bacterium]
MQKILANPGKLIIPLVILGLLAILVFSLSKKTQAPDVTFTTIEGKTIKMGELKGKLVLVNFWATDCPGCIAEMPQLIKTYRQYHDQGFEVIAVAMFYDPPDHVLNYTQKHSLPFPVMHDGYGKIAKSFEDVRLTPTSFIMDKQGRIIQRVVGELDFTSLHSLLTEQLGKNS